MAWNVYELVNEDRREVFVGVTDKDVGAELELDRAVPPAPIRHWDFKSERIRANRYKIGLTRFDAREAVRDYEAKAGWVLRRGL
ncbi:MAG: hypothetical protein HY553_21915 [Elusimicrobia bacterium]|nr:hypothetical protein [Elusimicrobiota bacterium]